MHTIIETLSGKKILQVNGEDYDMAQVLSSQRQEILASLVAGYEYLFIDEVQNVPGIGKNLKLWIQP
jgi:predicted AAA+ superfamily ATPase